MPIMSKDPSPKGRQSSSEGPVLRRPDAKPEIWLPPAKSKPAKAGGGGGGGQTTLVLVLLAIGLVANFVFTLGATRKVEPLEPPTDERVTELIAQVKALTTDLKDQRMKFNRQAAEMSRLGTDLQALTIKVSNLPLPPDPGHRNVPMDDTPASGQR